MASYRYPISSRLNRAAAIAVAAYAYYCSAAMAEVVRFEITSRESFENGREFGETGAYEKIVGTVHYAIDPKAKANGAIVDLEHAPRNAKERVEFSSDLFILAPKDLTRGNRAALYDVAPPPSLPISCPGRSEWIDD